MVIKQLAKVSSLKKLIVVVGPTAVGKTGVAIQIAKHLSCEILSADSRQFYQEMNIGTAKPDETEMDGIPHHFINNLSIHDNYSAGTFETEALAKLDEIYKNHDVAVLVGGSGLFVDALCHGLDDIPKASDELRKKLNDELNDKGLTHLQKRVQATDPEYYSKADVNNSRRLMRALEVFETTGKTLSSYQNLTKKTRPFDCIWIGLELPRANLYERINQRVDTMLNTGLLEEVESLREHKNLNPLKTVGYQEFYGSNDNERNLKINQTETAINLVKRNSRRYAKRQLTWFRRNKKTKWFNPDQSKVILNEIDLCL